jgi:membrane protease YdiL (CAAX protease family)
VPLALRPGWLGLVLGLFAQGGLAEETVFRGLLYGHLRQTRTFWRAAGLSMVPFLAVHLILFANLPFALAAASLALSAIVAFPLARLFDLGGPSLGPPAVLHFVIQGVVKLVVVPDERAPALALGWMAASALVPWLVFG